MVTFLQIRGWRRIESAGRKSPVPREAGVPRISTYYGIAIYMYYRDHAPPHFHAIYGEHEAIIEIAKAKVTDGSLPRRALKMVIEWTKVHRTELEGDWRRAQAGDPLRPIDP